MPRGVVSRLGKGADHQQRRTVWMDVIQRGLAIVGADEDRHTGGPIWLVIHRTFHEVLDNHAECHVTIGNLLDVAGAVNIVVGTLHAAGVFVRKVEVDKLRQRAIRHHAVEVLDEGFGPALVRDVEVVSRIVVIEVWLTVGVVLSHYRKTGQLHEECLAQTLHGTSYIAKINQRIGDVEVVGIQFRRTAISTWWVVEGGWLAGTSVGAVNAGRKHTIFFEADSVAGRIIEDVSALRVVFRLKVLVHQKPSPRFHQKRLLGIVGRRSGSSKLMAGIAFLRIGVIVHRSRKLLRQHLEVEGDAGVLPVRVGTTVRVVVGQAGENPEMTAEIAKLGVEGFVLLQNEHDMLDPRRRPTTYRYDRGVPWRGQHFVVVAGHGCQIQIVARQANLLK